MENSLETNKTETNKKDFGKKKSIVLIIFAMILIIGSGVGGYYYMESSYYFTTENAKVTADLRQVLPLSSGRLVKWNVSEGDFVKENDVMGRLQNGSYLRSPINGQIVKSNVILNQSVSPTLIAVVIADTSNIYISANIEETDITKIKDGQPVIIKLDAYPGQKFKGHVKEINQLTQSALSGNPTSFTTSGTFTKVTQLIPIKIVIDDNLNMEGLIGTNSTVSIKIK